MTDEPCRPSGVAKRPAGAAPGPPPRPAGPSPLDTSIQYVKGVGPKRAALFERLGVRTVEDLLYFAPRDYYERTQPIPIARVQVGQMATVCGTVIDQHLKSIGRGRTLFTLLVGDGTGVVQAVWFNQPYRADRFREGDRVVLSGKATLFDDALQMSAPEFEVLDAEEEEEAATLFGEHGPVGGARAAEAPRPRAAEGRAAPALAEGVVAVYPATEGLPQWWIRRVVRQAVETYGDCLVEPLPEALRQRDGLMSVKQAVAHLHLPPSLTAAAAARRRLKFQELFALQMGLALRRRRLREAQAAPIPVRAEVDQRIRRLFGFPLTAAQERVIAEIREDLAQPRPMNRLLQGDVGSGKTVVAVYGMLAAVANHLQAAVMAPTAILAEQHYARIDRMLAASRVKRTLLIGGASTAERRRALEEIAAGRVDLVVGTHAVIQKDVTFARLGLVVVDEQHKFGVAQRAMLRLKGQTPHCLVMTATPIPRTLAMTAFGDLDLSVLDEMPPGRQPVDTRYVSRAETAEAFEFIRREIKKGRQAYFVYPLIEEPAEREVRSPLRAGPSTGAPRKSADKRLPPPFSQAAAGASLKSAEEMYRRLRDTVYPELGVGLLHGRMKPEEKDRVMHDFRTRRIQVLVSTVVIEVGIDVPNATLMVIDHAERFGLAQLHQLRGRIGRGRYQSYCLLFADPGTEEAERRIRILTETNDGFRIAEEDLRLRGPGEFLGTRQHGLPELKLADIIEDADLLRLARKEAMDLVQADPALAAPEHAALRDFLRAKLGRRPGLTPIG